MARGPELFEWLKTRTTGMLMAFFACFAAICLACASLAQKTPESGVLRDRGEWLTQADVMPTYDFAPPQPRLPKMHSGEHEIMTKTTIEFYVDELGRVNPVLTNIKETSGYEALDRIALQWARKITFHPGMHQNKPVKVIVSKQIQWIVR